MQGAAEEVLGEPLPARVNRPRHEGQLGGPGCGMSRWSAVVGEAEVRVTATGLPVVEDLHSVAVAGPKALMKGVAAEAPVAAMAPPTKEAEEPALQARAARWTACESWVAVAVSSRWGAAGPLSRRTTAGVARCRWPSFSGSR